MTEPLHPESLSWAALLGRWLDLAAASTVLGEDQDGPQWRRSISSLVTLQAVVFALEEFHALEGEEKPVALDRAEVLVDDAREQLLDTWGDQMPESLVEAVTDAEEAIALLETSMVWVLLHTGGDPFRMPELGDTPCARFEGGTLAMVPPGTIVMPGGPVAWWSCRREPELVEAVVEHDLRLRERPIQVWRTIDEQGMFTIDRITDLDASPEQALPLLIPMLVDGEIQEAFPMNADDWSARLLERLPDRPLEVLWSVED